MRIRHEVLPFIAIAIIFSAIIAGIMLLLNIKFPFAATIASLIAIILIAYLLYFFRDPNREIPPGEDLIRAAADGVIAQIKEVTCPEFFGDTPLTRISIFLNLFNVHVNRAPISGIVKFIQYYPGKKFLTFKDKSSDYNQHTSILIKNKVTTCLINQIVGPVCRRVVHWLQLEQDLAAGQRFGMMKFGSRLDMYFPTDDIELDVKLGTHVCAGVSIIGKLKGEPPCED